MVTFRRRPGLLNRNPGLDVPSRPSEGSLCCPWDRYWLWGLVSRRLLDLREPCVKNERVISPDHFKHKNCSRLPSLGQAPRSCAGRGNEARTQVRGVVVPLNGRRKEFKLHLYSINTPMINKERLPIHLFYIVSFCVHSIHTNLVTTPCTPKITHFLSCAPPKKRMNA